MQILSQSANEKQQRNGTANTLKRAGLTLPDKARRSVSTQGSLALKKQKRIFKDSLSSVICN
uniref:Uncharacterized protein n=1 Tax=Anguilla anguilla TaxID=7936 RepID=A0A0E9WNC1_ANGAN